MAQALVQKILCPVDGSEFSAAGLKLAARLAAVCGARLTVLKTHQPDVPPYLTRGAAERVEVEIAEARAAEGTALREFVRKAIGEQESEVRVEDGDPRDVIPRVARELQASLIVMATHARTGIGRLAAGSIAEEVLHTGSTPLLTAGPHAHSQDVSSIVCAVNDSEAARRALSYSVRLAECLQARLVVLHVIEDQPRRAITDLCAWAGQHTPAGCQMQDVTRAGRAGDEILRLAREMRAGLLVIGAEHRRFSDHVMLGVTAEQVLRHADCPVLTVIGGENADSGSVV